MKKSHMLVAILGQIVLFNLIGLVVHAASFDEDVVFRHYRPLAMDESWEAPKYPRDLSSDDKVTSETPSIDAVPEVPPEDADNSEVGISNIEPNIISSSESEEDEETSLDSGVLTEVENSGDVNVSENLFRLPGPEEKTTPALTRLISGKERATLVQDHVSMPRITPKDEVNPKSKILATYQVLVPVFIPALNVPAKIPTARRAPVKYVQEVHTEMVPVKKSVSRVKNVIKMERVPQKIITNYVKANETTVPFSVDAKLKPNEKVLKSVVTNFD